MIKVIFQTSADAEKSAYQHNISLQYLHEDKAVQERQQAEKSIHNGGKYYDY